MTVGWRSCFGGMGTSCGSGVGNRMGDLLFLVCCVLVLPSVAVADVGVGVVRGDVGGLF